MMSKPRNRDLKQSEDLQTLEKIAHYASQLQAQQLRKLLWTLLRSETILKQNKKRTLNFKAFYKVARSSGRLLTSSYFFFNNTTSYETQIAQTKSVTLQIILRY
jgi:hypothetical protein